MSPLAHNVRRLMARNGLTLRELVAASGLHERTVKATLAGHGKPHARTLHRLAAGLKVSTDELFQTSAALTHRVFDRQTNPAVQQVVEQRPELFTDWSDAEFEELYSHFGTGGALTPEGATELVMALNQKRVVHRKVALLLESDEADVLIGLVDVLYEKIAVGEI